VNSADAILAEMLVELRSIRELLSKQSGPAARTLTNVEAAKALGVGVTTFGEMVRDGKVRRVPVNGRLRTPVAEIERLASATAPNSGARGRPPRGPRPAPAVQDPAAGLAQLSAVIRGRRR
jgi:hypothetical protein